MLIVNYQLSQFSRCINGNNSYGNQLNLSAKCIEFKIFDYPTQFNINNDYFLPYS